MKIKVKFANKEVNVKKLVQGAVVLADVDEYGPSLHHIHKFVCFHEHSNTVDLVIADDTGKWSKNSADLTWPI